MAKKKKSAKKPKAIRIDYHLKGKPQRIVGLYRVFSSMARSYGPVKVKITKASINFWRNRTFVVVWLNDDSLEGVIDLYSKVKDRRFKGATKISRFIYSNKFKIKDKKQLNASFARFLGQSYRVGVMGSKTSLK